MTVSDDDSDFHAERARLIRLFDGAPGFVAAMAGPEHRFLYVNRAHIDIFGDRDYAGQTARDVFPELAAEGHIALLDRAHRGESVNGRAMSVNVTGPSGQSETHFFDFALSAITGPDGKVTGVLSQGFEVTATVVAERAQRQSESRFRAAIDAVHGVLWTNSPDGEMLGEQPGWSALTGQSQREYEGYGWADAVHPDDARPTIDAWNLAVGERRPFNFEHRVRRHDGEWRHFAVRAIPSLDEDGSIREWIGVHTDITDERAMQTALLESEENYRFAVDLHPQVTWTARPDGLLDRVAERWLEWTGTSGLGSTWGEGLHPDDLGYTTDAWVHSVTTGEPYDVEHRVKRLDGSFRWARSRAFPRHDAQGEICKWYGATEDVDDRKRAEIRAFESARELRGVIEAMPGFVWTADDQGGITYTSPSWQTYSGSMADESLGAGWAGFVHADDQPQAFAQWASSLTSGEPYEVEFRLRAADNTYRWWLARAQKQPEGGWIGTATELDAIVAARETLARSREQLETLVLARTAELREAEEQLRQSQKLEAVGQLTGGVAHDFNNLLTVIRGSVDLLRRPGITEDRRDRYIEAISDTVTRAAKLTGQLLAFARRQALKPDVIDVGAALSGIADMIGTLSGSRIRVEMDLPDAPLFIDADPSQFDTAIVNMVANARDAMSGEGTLSIAIAHNVGIPPNGGSAIPGDYVAVAITDTGSGISPELQLQIFEPFYTTKGVGQGTGLGLSQVYGFAKQSGGEIRLCSAPGEGSTFTLFLPRVAAPADGPALKAGPGHVVDGSGICVLVVEDNAEVGHFAKQTLAELGYQTVFAGNGEAALAELAEGHARFDVVFSDVMMPGMSGIELGEAIRARYPGLPVVLTSGYSHVLARHGSAGFELLHKPYSMEELSRVLQKAAATRDPA